MTDSPTRARREAQAWPRTAEAALRDARDDEASVAVACAEATHAILRANGALCLHFLSLKGTRHDDAPLLFLKLVRKKFLQKEDKRFSEIVSAAVRAKNGADYGKEDFFLRDAKLFVADATAFLDMVRRYVS